MKKSQIFFTTFLALPLSFVGIPIYLNIADFYSQKFGLSLVLIGTMLAAIRVFDAIQDPFIGYFSDFLCRKKISRKKIVNFFALLLCFGFFLTFNPIDNLKSSNAAIWFFATLSLTYLCFNFVIINFEASIALIAKNDKQRISLNSAKEFLGLIGMILAFTIPGVLVEIFDQDQEQNYFYLTIIFISLIFINIFLFLPKTNISHQVKTTTHKLHFSAIIRDKKFVNFIVIFLLNSIAVSLPAANMKFYVREVLSAQQHIPFFLATYFLSACFFIPMWNYFFDRFGIIKSWIFSICGSVITFAFAYFLNDSNASYFYLVCILSGIFLGADLIAIPAILSKITQDKNEIASSYFSIWNFFTKIGLMIAASGSLIILGFFDYQPGNLNNENLNLIAFFYAALPCFIKLIVVTLLLKFQKYDN